MAAEYVCCSLTSQKKKSTLTTANRMLRNCQEDIRLCYDIRGNRTINMTLVTLFLVGNKDHFNLSGRRTEGNVLFNDALNTFFYLRLYGVRLLVNYYSDTEKGNPLPPHGLLYPISRKGSFISIIPQTG